MEIKEEIKEKLRSLAEKEYKKLQEKICPGQEKILGVRIPHLRAYAKEIAKQDWRSYLEEIDDEYFEENMLYGLVVGYSKMDWNERLTYIEKFVPRINNWAVCDSCTVSFKFIQKNREAFWRYIEKYASSDQEFENRFALICLLDHYIIPEYIERIFKIIDKIQSDEYYVSMAKAWLIAELFIKHEKQTEQYLKETKVSDVTYNRAIQKMLDSYRVDSKKKDELRARKRKK